MLTVKKKKYAEARLRGLNINDSAIEAGCPEKTARQAGSRMERDKDVLAAMGRIAAVAEVAKPAKEKSVKQEKTKQTARPAPVPDTVYIPAPVEDGDPIAFMTAMMNDVEADPKLRLDAAKAKAMFTVAKPGETGKKEEKNKAAGKAATGRFSTAKPPLSVVKS